MQEYCIDLGVFGPSLADPILYNPHVRCTERICRVEHDSRTRRLCIAMAIEVVDRFELVGTGRGTRQEGKQAERQTGRGTWQTHIYVGTQSSRDGYIEREREESARRKETNRRTGQGKAERQADRQAHAGRCTNKSRRDRETDQMYSKQERE